MNTVMKTYTYTKTMTFVVMFLIATMVAGCREGFDFEEARGEKYFEDKKIEYIEAFEDAFCNGVQINPDHTWGFGEMKSEEDLMRQAMTRSANCNSNEWANTYIVPSAVTEEEREVVYNFFKTYSNTLESESFNYSEFFVQQVWHGTDVYKDGYGNNVVGGEKMNQLMAGGEHVNNFNGANGDIMLMVNSNTRSFGYWNSCDGKQHSGTNEYKILYVVGYGWYLGFDFMANGQNKNEQVAGDGVYTDWIIKVTPGVSKETKRILCEDLGSIGDFDYNDAVFDVNYISDTKARITLRAAGATLPIYIGKFDPAYEVHNLFDVEPRTMVNTNRRFLEGNVNSGVVTKPAVVFEIDVNSKNPIDIPIIVGEEGNSYALTAEQGAAPHKICVPINVEWTNERLPINAQYKSFSQWVSNPEIGFWEGVDLWKEHSFEYENNTAGLTESEIAAKNEPVSVEPYVLSLDNLGSGWSSSYNASSKTISYDSNWAGRGWWFGNDPGLDFSSYSRIEIKTSALASNCKLIVEYYGAGNSEAYVNAGSTTMTLDFDANGKKNVKQIYIQICEINNGGNQVSIESATIY